MKFETDTLKWYKLMESKGCESHLAKAIICTICEMEISNLYSKEEMQTMLAKTVEKVFQDNRRYQDVQHREFEKRMELAERRIENDVAEIRSLKRWVIGLMVTVAVGIVSSHIHLLHLIH